jgi:flagellar FliL protein
MAQDPVVEEAVAEEAPKKSKKKLIIIIVAVLLLVAIGGGAAWYFLHSKATPAGANSAKKEEPKEEAASAEPIFVKLETFTLNLEPSEGEKFLQTDISLNVATEEEAKSLEQHMPQVRNRILMLLSSKKPSEITSMEGKKALSNEITTQINQPFTSNGKPQKILGVFFTSFVIQ